MMKKLLLLLATLLVPSLAWAQCNGVFPANTVCGNTGGSPNTPQAVIPSALTFSNITAQSITLTPPSGTPTQGFFIVQNGPLSGTTPGTSTAFSNIGKPTLVYNDINIIEGANVTPGTPTYTTGMNVGMFTGTANSQGSKTALTANLIHGSASSPSSPRDHAAATFIAWGSVSDGGTNTSSGAQGTLFGVSAAVQAQSGAVNHLEFAGAEFDVGILTGASSRYRFGTSVVDNGNLQAADTRADAAYELGAGGSSPGFKTAFLLDNLHGGAPLSTTGCVICTDGSSVTITTGIDLSAYTISGNFLASPGFSVGGAGGALIGTATGGNKGAGTINVSSGIFLNNSAYTNPDYVLEKFYTNKIERFANKPGAATYSGLMPLDQLENHLRTNLRLPGITDAPADIFERSDLMLQKMEEMTLYILQLKSEIDSLKKKRVKVAMKGSR